MVLTLLLGSTILGHFIAVTKIPMITADWLCGLALPSWGIILLISVIYLVGGSFIDDLAFMILATPIFYPAIIKLGYDPLMVRDTDWHHRYGGHCHTAGRHRRFCRQQNHQDAARRCLFGCIPVLTQSGPWSHFCFSVPGPCNVAAELVDAVNNRSGNGGQSYNRLPRRHTCVLEPASAPQGGVARAGLVVRIIAANETPRHNRLFFALPWDLLKRFF